MCSSDLAEEAEDAPLADREVDPLEGVHVAEGLLQPLREDGGLGHGRQCTSLRGNRMAQPTSSAAISSKTAVWRSTSACVVAGHMSAMLWKGVRRIPRLSA